MDFYMVGAILIAVAFYIGMQFRAIQRLKKLEGHDATQLKFPGNYDFSNGRHMLYFYTPTCAACRSMTPIINEMSGSNKNVYSIDASVRMDIARSFQIMATPTTIVVDNGKIDKIMVGAKNEKQLNVALAG